MIKTFICIYLIMAEIINLRPQPGFQEKFLASSADIVFGGGAAGAGKTFALLIEPLRHMKNKNFGGIIFRRTTPQIRNEGGLWDSSQQIYSNFGASPKETVLEWKFKSGAKLKFSHLEHEKNKLDYQGSQIPFIGFDEITHFSESQFFYLLSRNRSTCGVRPYIRATCNPDADSWVRNFIDWWVDKDGFIIKEREGIIRYFTRDGENIVWGDTGQEIIDKCPHIFNNPAFAGKNMAELIKSFTFIEGDIYENTELLSKDPGYLANLLAQDEEEKLRLLDKNWNIKPDGNCIFTYDKIEEIEFNTFAQRGTKYLSIDAARFGSDLATLWVWDEDVIIDADLIPVSATTDIAAKTKAFENQYKIPRGNVIIDSDGIGGGVVDLLPGCKSFVNNATAVKQQGSKNNYQNLKTQCYYLFAEDVNNNKFYVIQEVANRKYKGTRVIDMIKRELRAIKRDKPDSDGKLQIIPKEKMKNILGHSPDCADGLMMKSFYKIRGNTNW